MRFVSRRTHLAVSALGFGASSSGAAPRILSMDATTAGALSASELPVRARTSRAVYETSASSCSCVGHPEVWIDRESPEGDEARLARGLEGRTQVPGQLFQRDAERL